MYISILLTLRLNTTLTELDLCGNDLGVEQESALREAWGGRGGSFRLRKGSSGNREGSSGRCRKGSSGNCPG